MKRYKCMKNRLGGDGNVAFTEGKYYLAEQTNYIDYYRVIDNNSRVWNFGSFRFDQYFCLPFKYGQ